MLDTAPRTHTQCDSEHHSTYAALLSGSELIYCKLCRLFNVWLLDPEGGSQKATLVVLFAVVVSSLRVQKSLRLS